MNHCNFVDCEVLTLSLLFFPPLEELELAPEHLKTGVREVIDRTITIDKDLITIKTAIPEGYDIQTLKIVEKHLNNETIPPIVIYDCTSPDGVYPTLLFIPQREIISEILIIQPSLIDGKEEQFSFHLETRNSNTH